MKSLKLIITNLIGIAMLVILTGGVVYAENPWDVKNYPELHSLRPGIQCLWFPPNSIKIAMT